MSVETQVILDLALHAKDEAHTTIMGVINRIPNVEHRSKALCLAYVILESKAQALRAALPEFFPPKEVIDSIFAAEQEKASERLGQFRS